MNRDRIGVKKPHRDGGLGLTPSSVDLGYGDGGTSHNSSINVEGMAPLTERALSTVV